MLGVQTLDRLAEAIHAIGRELWLVAGTAGVSRRGALAEEMSRPRPGDLVIVLPKFHPDGVGWLLRQGDAESVVEPLAQPGRQVHWHDVTVIAVPVVRVSAWMTARDGDGTGGAPSG